MNIIRVDNENLQEFITYCKTYRSEHDDSYLYDEDFVNFSLGIDEPAFLLVDDENKVAGAISIMLKNYRSIGKARIRVLHALQTKEEHYQQLLEMSLPHVGGIKEIYLFLPNNKEDVISILLNQKFTIERYSFYLSRTKVDVTPPTFPEGFRLEPIKRNQDEERYCQIKNESFAKLAGTIPLTPEEVQEYYLSEQYLENGMQILWHDEKPVGILCVSSDENEGEKFAFIDTIGIIPEYQGKGLGRNLVRAGIAFGRSCGYVETQLSVNAENCKAVELYKSEGFEVVTEYTCLTRKVND